MTEHEHKWSKWVTEMVTRGVFRYVRRCECGAKQVRREKP